MLQTKKLLSLLIMFPVFVSCGQTAKQTNSSTRRLEPAAKTISSRFPTPAGFEKPIFKSNSFQYYLSNFPLKPYGSKVYYFNGDLKPNTNVYISVLDIDVGNSDLQQCADAVMRLRAEYLYSQKRFTEIHFNFTNGFRVDYSKWAEGYRIRIVGNSTSWYKATSTDYSYKTFKAYLTKVFMYAGTLSLSKELKKIPLDSIQVGDVFIKGGSPGHAVIVVDVAINKATGKRIFMIAQSYMPAQSIHILVNDNNKSLSPWYDLSETDRLYTPEWTFEKSELKRF